MYGCHYQNNGQEPRSGGPIQVVLIEYSDGVRERQD